MITTNDINDSTEIWVGDRRYFGIARIGIDEGRKISGFVLDLYTTKSDEAYGRGSFFSIIPISPKDFRAQNPNKARAEIVSTDTIKIYDDWGSPTSISLYDRSIFDRLVDELGEANLLTSILGYSRAELLDALKEGDTP